MIIEDEELLKSWIIKDVAALTDADADRLAMYVIALLKKPLSDQDLLELCSEKLDVFLQANTKDFVDRLFECLKNNAYLPDGSGTGAIEDLVLTDGSDQEDKWDSETQEDSKATPKSADYEDKEKPTERDTLIVADVAKRASSADKLVSASSNGTSRPVRRRISPPPSDRHSSRNGVASQRFSPSRNRRSNLPPRRSPPPRGRTERYHRRRSYSRSRSRSRSPHREKRRDEHDGSGRRHRCRDFHEKGFCMRGDKCNYDHGPDPVVIENAALEKIVNRSGSATIAPPVSSASLYSPGNPPPPGVGDSFTSETPTLTTAEATAVGNMDFSVPPPPLPIHLAPTAAAMPTMLPVVPSIYASTIAPSSSALVTVVPNMQTVQAYNNQPGQGIVATSMTPTMTTQMQDNYNVYGNGAGYGHRGGYGGRGRGGRGRFKPYGAPLVNPALCSLLVKKIPPEQNKIVLLDQHFGKFGQITNLHVQYEGQPDTALVTFKTRREALSAYKSTEPIFNNRFIKVFWQTQPEGTTENGVPDQTGVQPIKTDVVAPAVPITTDPIPLHVKTENALDTPKSEGAKTEAHNESGVSDELNTSTSSAPPNMGPKRAIYNPRAAAAAKKKAMAHENRMKLVELQRLKMDLYQKQMEQQKELLQRIQATESKETKKKIMELVKKCEESMKAAKADLESLSAKISAH